MKKLMSSMLAIAAMASMISCSTEDILDEGGQIDNGPVEIKLNAGVSATTKAAINDNFTEDFNVLFYKPANGSTVDWTTGEKILAVVDGTDLNHPIIFKETDGTTNKKLYYDDKGENSHLVACHIGDSKIGTDNLTSGNISFTITGQQDIMATDGQNGNKTDQFQPFEFQHLLSQIEIKIQGDAAAKATFGTIKKVEIKDVDTQLKLTLGQAPSITPVESAPLANITVYDEPTGKDLTADATTIGSTVMIYDGGDAPYGTSTKDLTLKVTSSKDGVNNIQSEVKVNNITDNTNNGLEAGKKHVITLNFKERINATASVVAWGTGGTGNGSVE